MSTFDHYSLHRPVSTLTMTGKKIKRGTVPVPIDRYSLSRQIRLSKRKRFFSPTRRKRLCQRWQHIAAALRDSRKELPANEQTGIF